MAVSKVSLPPSGIASRAFTGKLELIWISECTPQSAVQNCLDSNMLAESPAQQVGHTSHQAAEFNGFWVEWLLA